MVKMNLHSQDFLATCTRLAERGDIAPAMALVKKFLEAAPDHAIGHFAMGIVNMHAGDYQGSIASYRRAIEIDPKLGDAEWNLALQLLRHGELAEGYRHYEARWHTEAQSPEARTYDKPLWLGKEPIDGKILHIWHEQGFGDFIQMARYFPLIAARAEMVYVEAHLGVANLTSDSMPANVKILEPFHAPLEYDYHTPLMSLPLAMGTELATVPGKVPYLTVADDYREKWQHILGPKKKPRIGLAWSGSAGHPNDANRSIPLALLLDVLNLPADIHSLQKELRDYDVHDARLLTLHTEEILDFADTAALIEQMDLVISVDTSVAHLAGALGKDLRLLLPRRGDYRWMLKKPTSPWYPTAKLYHQHDDGDWIDTIKRMVAELP